MTYEERVSYAELSERVSSLKERLADGHADGPVTRQEARELVAALETVVHLISTERFERMMDTIADEAARRAGAFTPAGR